MAAQLRDLVQDCAESAAAAIDITSAEALWPLSRAPSAAPPAGGGNAAAGAGDGPPGGLSQAFTIDKTADKQRWLQVGVTAWRAAAAL